MGKCTRVISSEVIKFEANSNSKLGLVFYYCVHKIRSVTPIQRGFIVQIHNSYYSKIGFIVFLCRIKKILNFIRLFTDLRHPHDIFFVTLRSFAGYLG